MSPTPASNAACFPSLGLVLLESGRIIAMRQLQVGDRVHAGSGIFSEVYTFTHKTEHIISDFIQLRTASGKVISLSPGHYIPVSGKHIAARAVKVGDLVTVENGLKDRVAEISYESLRGLYNPQTLDGYIVVDGVLTSTFTEAVRPSTANALLVPLKLLCRMGYYMWQEIDGSQIVARLPKGGLIF